MSKFTVSLKRHDSDEEFVLYDGDNADDAVEIWAYLAPKINAANVYLESHADASVPPTPGPSPTPGEVRGRQLGNPKPAGK